MATGNFIYTFSIFIIASYILSGIFIVAVRGVKPPMLYISLNRFLGAFFAIVNLFQTAHTPLYGQVLWNPLHILMSLTLYPLLFTYIFGLLRPGCVGVRYLLLTFLPAAIFTALYFIFETLFGKLPLFTGYAEIRNYLGMPHLWIKFMAAGLSFAIMCFFTLKAIGMLRRHKRNLESNFSYTEGSTLRWMWWAIGIALFQWGVILTAIMFEGNIGQLIGLFLFTLEPIIITIFILRQKDLYGEFIQKNDSGEEVIFGGKSNDSGSVLSLKKHEDLKNRLLLLLEKNEIFINPDLSSGKVSEMLYTNRTYLSQVINNDLNTTFYKLINTYRLRKSADMMRDPLHCNMSLKNIAEICGFKSLSAFSTLFKQEYGKTPTEWVEE